MDTAARIFNWLGYIGAAVTFLVLAIDFGVVASSYECSAYSYHCYTSQTYEYYHTLSIAMWICFAVYAAIFFFVSIWIDKQITGYGNTVAAGIVSFLFFGVIGGLLTLMSGASYRGHSYSSYSSSSESGSSSTYHQYQPASSSQFKVGEKYKTTRRTFCPYGPIAKGQEVVITKIYSASVMGDVVLENGEKQNVNFAFSDLVIKDEDEKSSSEINNIKLLKEYKSLLDDGIITQAEFDSKKKELLSK